MAEQLTVLDAQRSHSHRCVEGSLPEPEDDYFISNKLTAFLLRFLKLSLTHPHSRLPSSPLAHSPVRNQAQRSTNRLELT